MIKKERINQYVIYGDGIFVPLLSILRCKKVTKLAIRPTIELEKKFKIPKKDLERGFLIKKYSNKHKVISLDMNFVIECDYNGKPIILSKKSIKSIVKG